MKGIQVSSIIKRRIDGRAIMEGSNACSVRWGKDAARVCIYDSPEQAAKSLDLLCDEEDEAYVCELESIIVHEASGMPIKAPWWAA